MALTKRTENDKIEILIDGHIQVRTATIVEDDGVEISRSFHRRVIAPDADVAAETDDIKGFAGFARTPAKVTAYLARKAEDI